MASGTVVGLPERKSLSSDLVGSSSSTHDRDRFIAELERLEVLRISTAVQVVEASMADIVYHRYRSAGDTAKLQAAAARSSRTTALSSSRTPRGGRAHRREKVLRRLLTKAHGYRQVAG